MQLPRQDSNKIEKINKIRGKVMFKGFKKLIIIMGGISLMMILTACDLVKKITNGFKNIENT